MRITWLNDELTRARVTQGVWFRKTGIVVMTTDEVRYTVPPWDDDPREVPHFKYEASGCDVDEKVDGSLYVSRNNELDRRLRARLREEESEGRQPARGVKLPPRAPTKGEDDGR